MRQKKEDTIAQLKDEFLAGKSEEYREKFNQKTTEQQYVAIMNWKRSLKKLGEATGDLAKATVTNVLNQLKEAHKSLTQLTVLSPKDAAKVQSLVDNFKDSINNFEKVKKEQQIAALKTLQNKLQKQGKNLEKKIAKLQQELG